MLRDFIQDEPEPECSVPISLSDAEALGEEEIAIRFKYRGTMYRTPKFPRKEYGSIGNITIRLNDSAIQTKDGGNRLFSRLTTGQSVSIACESGMWEGQHPDVTAMSMFLYRMGVPTPIGYDCRLLAEDTAFQLNIQLKDNKLEPGKYFLFLPLQIMWGEAMYDEVNKGLCYAFDVLPDGHLIEHPRLTDVSAVSERMALSDTALYYPGRLRLFVELEGLTQWKNELSVLCYDEDETLMATACKIVRGNRAHSHELTFNLDAERIWMPENYTAILCINQVPFSKIRIDATQQEDIYCEISPLLPDDPFHWMVSEMEFGKLRGWELVRETPGLRQEKNKLIGLHRRFVQSKRNGGKRKSELILIESDSNFHSARIAFCTDLFRQGRDSFDFLSCDVENHYFTERQERFMNNRVNRAFALHHLDKLLTDQGDKLLKALLNSLQTEEEMSTIVLCGSRQVIDTLCRLYPDIANSVADDCRIRIADIRPSESVRELTRLFADAQCWLTDEALDTLYRKLKACWDTYQLSGWSHKEQQAWVEHTRAEAYERRMEQMDSEEEGISSHTLIESTDIDLAEFLNQNRPQHIAQTDDEQRRAYTKAMQELDDMIGLKEVKEGMNRLFTQVMFNKQRTTLGLPVKSGTPHHIIFTGNPGTGKTTVAKLMGRIYKAMGLLSKGEVVATERGELVGEYLGHTENKMQEMLKKAQGNVLFIDEAYALYSDSDDRKDFGNRVIECLLPKLAEPNPDMVVIFAGYEEDMKNLMQQNKGLKSRFAHQYRFEDYTADELLQIALSELTKYRYTLTDEARDYLQKVIVKAVLHKDRDFSNARWALQLVNNGILPAMAQRVVGSHLPVSPEAYSQIQLTDIEAAARLYAKEESRPVRRIGFTR